LKKINVIIKKFPKLINLNYDDKTSDLGLVPENVMAWHAFMLYVLPIHNAVALGKIILG